MKRGLRHLLVSILRRVDERLNKPVDRNILGGTVKLPNQPRDLSNRAIHSGLITDKVDVYDRGLRNDIGMGCINQNTRVRGAKGVGIANICHIAKELPRRSDRTGEGELMNIGRISLFDDGSDTS